MYLMIVNKKSAVFVCADVHFINNFITKQNL